MSGSLVSSSLSRCRWPQLLQSRLSLLSNW